MMKGQRRHPFTYGWKVFFGEISKLLSNVSIKEMPGALALLKIF
jgi:hypothetical protein